MERSAEKQEGSPVFRPTVVCGTAGGVSAYRVVAEMAELSFAAEGQLFRPGRRIRVLLRRARLRAQGLYAARIHPGSCVAASIRKVGCSSVLAPLVEEDIDTVSSHQHQQIDLAVEGQGKGTRIIIVATRYRLAQLVPLARSCCLLRRSALRL